MTTTKSKSEPALEILDVRRKDLLMLDPRLINVIPDFNDRVDYGDMNELVESIRENGILQPVLGFMDNKRYFIKSGHRRLRAAMTLIEQGEPILVPFSSGKKCSFEEMLIESFLSNDGKRFNAIEEASLVGKLLKRGLKATDIATKLSRTTSHISNLAKLNSLPTKLKNNIAAEAIASTLVLDIVRSTINLSVDELAEAIQKIIDDKSLGGSNKKITRKDVDKAIGKTNSFSAVKKALKLAAVRTIKEENRHLFDLLTKLNNGDYSLEEMIEQLYEPATNK